MTPVRSRTSWRSVAKTALGCLFVVILASAFALKIQGGHDRAALTSAKAALTNATAGAKDAKAALVSSNAALVSTQSALAKATAAQQASVTTLAALQNSVAAECVAVNYLRWQVDKERYASWRRDQVAAFLLHRSITRAGRHLGKVFHAAAETDLYLPLTDCQQAQANPTKYQLPLAVPFSSVRKRELRRILSTPPLPGVKFVAPHHL